MAVLKTTWHHVRRSPYQAFAAILIMTLTFFVVSVFTFVIYGSSRIISYFESKPQVTAFFKDEAKKENIDALKDQLKSSGKVAQVRFVSKQEALKIYKEQNKNDPLLLELVTADILPASLEISAVNIKDLSSISDVLKNSSYVQEVIFQKDVVATLTSWTDALRKIGIGLIAVLLSVSIFITGTIIGLKIAQKKDEIEIMRLLGATYWYIRWPFLLEGILYSFLGSLLGWFLAAGLLWWSTPGLNSFLKGIPLLPIDPVLLLMLLGLEFLLALILGMFASFLAVLRYLK